MGFEYVSKLPTPDEIRAQFPLAPALAAEKAKKDEAIKDVYTGKSDKFLAVSYTHLTLPTTERV